MYWLIAQAGRVGGVYCLVLLAVFSISSSEVSGVIKLSCNYVCIHYDLDRFSWNEALINLRNNYI